jgi:deoxyxylulose-5-phosphate synthase
MRKKFSELIKPHLENDDVSLVLGDISVGLFIDEKNNITKNVINAGILEQSMVSFSAGMANLHPVFVHTISPFLIERAYEQIKLDIVYNDKPVILVSANGPFEYSKLGPTHHCPNDVPLLNLLPDIEIYLPGRIEDLEKIFKKILANPKPSYIRLTNNVLTSKINFEIIQEFIFYRNINSKKLKICVGEALNDNLDDTSDILYVINAKNILNIDISKYEEIEVYEPYNGSILEKDLKKIKKDIKYFTFNSYFINNIYNKNEYTKN